eukprot:13436114-Alexandrium_andersonii.AAC.1
MLLISDPENKYKEYVESRTGDDTVPHLTLDQWKNRELTSILVRAILREGGGPDNEPPRVTERARIMEAMAAIGPYADDAAYAAAAHRASGRATPY